MHLQVLRQSRGGCGVALRAADLPQDRDGRALSLWRVRAQVFRLQAGQVAAKGIPITSEPQFRSDPAVVLSAVPLQFLPARLRRQRQCYPGYRRNSPSGNRRRLLRQLTPRR